MALHISDDKLREIISYYVAHGEKETLGAFGIKKHDTLRRYLDEAKKREFPEMDKSRLLGQIAEQYTDKELQAIAKGGRIIPGVAKVPIISFEGQRVRIGAITDTHVGHNRFDKSRLFQAFEEFRKEKVEFIVHAGDVTEGMSNRAGHVYELNHIGYDAQKTEAINLFSQWNDTDIYAIDGNHDRWFLKSNGAIIVKDIDKELDNFHFLGHDEGDISLGGKATLKLWHGEDGSSYALSYRLQKILESLSGGEKPHAMLAGHVHKHVYIFERNVHCTSIGTLQAQTRWMRSKRIAAHVGFAIIDYWVNKSGICKVTQTWYPFYT